MAIIKDIISGGLSGILDSAKGIISAFKADPNKVLEADQKIKELENKAQEIANNLTISLEQENSKQLESINATMREEAKSDHWAQWLWRPVLGFIAGAVIINNYILARYINGVHQITLDSDFWMFMTAVLGLASLGRSATKWQSAKNEQK